MFSGIVQGIASVVKIVKKNNFQTHTLFIPYEVSIAGLIPGSSVAHNGCCLTVTSIDKRNVSFDLIAETLRVTNLGELKEGDEVNLERSLKIGDEIGGHLLSGHIIDTVEIIDKTHIENSIAYHFSLPTQLAPFVFNKGYVALDGISLSVVKVSDYQFSVQLIPETLSRTTLASKPIGARVNIEIDGQTQVIVETVNRFLQSQKKYFNIVD